MLSMQDLNLAWACLSCANDEVRWLSSCIERSVAALARGVKLASSSCFLTSASWATSRSLMLTVWDMADHRSACHVHVTYIIEGVTPESSSTHGRRVGCLCQPVATVPAISVSCFGFLLTCAHLIFSGHLPCLIPSNTG
jgi:hypothetical protein